jgi:phosphoglycolate phosphatase-like HAD superfamily hydrolase
MTTTGIICDVGGTLLLTDELHRAAWRDALQALGLLERTRLYHAYDGFARGLDSFSTARSMGLDEETANLLARHKQKLAQVPRDSEKNTRTVAWLKGHPGANLVAVSHSDERWTREMLQRAGLLYLFCFVRGRRESLPISKEALLSDSATILRRWWEVEEIIYCGDTEHDRDVAIAAGYVYVDARAL